MCRHNVSELFKAITLECLSEDMGLEDEPE